MARPALVVFGGLPATGKSTLARAIAQEMAATYLRIDTIEQALRSSGLIAGDIGPAGYLVAYALAENNLRLGQSVVADSVNPIAITREAWRRVAEEASASIVEIEVVCSDPALHRRRVETRTVDVPGLVPPTWQEVVDRDYEPWDRPRIRLDTANSAFEDSLAELQRAIERVASGGRF
ncbi:MAG TPA: AAA family ATPase [Rhizomicrobium sp.]|nr:AAA family ATPase [Rhizomicrobium sp.]